MLKNLFILCTVLLFQTQTFAYKIIRDTVMYVNEIAIPITIVLPDGDGPYPVLFNVHGGGWNGGTATEVPDSDVGEFALEIVDETQVIHVGLGYRCKLQGGTFQEAMKEIDASFEWFKKKANRFNADMTRYGFTGGSAGTPLSAVYAFSKPDCKIYIGVNGMYDLSKHELKYSKFPDPNTSKQYKLITKEEKQAASTVNFVQTKHIPKTLLLHGDYDDIIDMRQSFFLQEKIKENGGVCELKIFNEIPHAFLRPFNPALYHESCLAIADLYISEFDQPKSIRKKVDHKMKKMLKEFYDEPNLKEELIIGTWSCPKKWQIDAIELKLDAKGKGTMKINEKEENIAYTLQGESLNVVRGNKEYLFKLQQNHHMLYYIRRKPYLGKKVLLSKQKKSNL